MLYNVRFDTIDSYKDLGLILNSRDISAPEVKTNYVDIDGADGSIDMTEALGEIRYENRKIKLEFTSVIGREFFWYEFSRCQNLLHGRKFKIIFSDDEDWYYIGRISIDKWKTDKVLGTMNFDIECEPYKYWRDLTVIKYTVSNSQKIRLFNHRMPVNPIIQTSSVMSLVFNNKTIISPNNEKFNSSDIKLVEGDNWLTVNGNGTITIEYQMGSL